MAAAPKNAQDYLRDNPDSWKQYRTKYGSLPEDFTPPPASEAAVEYYRANPDTADKFVEAFGYTPPSLDEKDLTPAPATIKEEAAVEQGRVDPKKAAAAVASVNQKFSGKGGKGGQFSSFDMVTPDRVQEYKASQVPEEPVADKPASRPLTPEIAKEIKLADTLEEKVKLAVDAGVGSEEIYKATRGAAGKLNTPEIEAHKEKVDAITSQYKGMGRPGFDIPKGRPGKEGSWGEITNDILANAPAKFGRQWVGAQRYYYSEQKQDLDNYADQLETAAALEGRDLASSSAIEVAAAVEGKSVPGYLADLGERRSSIAESDQEAQEQFQKYSRYLEAYAPRTKENSAKWWVGAAADAFINMGPALAVGMLTKNPNLSLALMGTQVYGDSYGQAREDGRTHDQATQDATAAAVFEVLAEKIPLDYIMKGGAGDALLKRVLMAAGMEGAEEVITEALNMGYETGVLEKDITLGEAFTRLYQAGGIGALVGVPMAVATHPMARKAAAQQEDADKTYKVFEEKKEALRDRLKAALDPKQNITRDQIAQAREEYEDAKMAIEDPEGYQAMLEQERTDAEKVKAEADKAALEGAEPKPTPESRLSPEEQQTALQKIRDGESDNLSPDTLHSLEEQGFIKFDGKRVPRILPSGRRAAKGPVEKKAQVERIVKKAVVAQEKKEARPDIEPVGVDVIQEPQKVESAAIVPLMEETDAATLRKQLDQDDDIYSARTEELKAMMGAETTDPAQRLAIATALDARATVVKSRDTEVKLDQENTAWAAREDAKTQQAARTAEKKIKQMLEAKNDQDVEMAEALSLFYENQDFEDAEPSAIRQAFAKAKDSLAKKEVSAKAEWKKWFDESTQGELFDVGEVVARGTRQYTAAVEIGAYKMARGVIRIADWSAAMIEELGARIKPSLKSMYSDAKKMVTDTYRLSHKKYKSGARKGQFTAAPKGTTDAKLTTLRAKVRQLAGEGKPGRMWYEESGEEILKVTGGNMEEARLLAGLLSIYSSGTAVNANTVNALKAWSQFKAGGEIRAGRFGHQDDVASAWLNSGVEPTGMKRSNFYTNLMRKIDPENFDVGQGTTVDLWMMRAFGYETDSPTDAQYAFVQTELIKLADELGWEPQQVQAAIWVAMKARWEETGAEAKNIAIKKGFGVIKSKGKAKFLDAKGEPGTPEYAKNKEKILKTFRDLALKLPHGIAKREVRKAKASFKDTMELHYGVISWEAQRSEAVSNDSGMSLEAKIELQAAVADALTNPETGREFIAEWLGLLGAEQFQGVGAWNLKIGQANQNLLLMPQEHTPEDYKSMDVEANTRVAMDGYAAIMGMLLEQDAVAWGRSFYATRKSDANGVEIDIDRALKPYEAKKFYLEIVRLAQEEFGITQEAAMEFAPIAMPWGFKVQSYNTDVPNFLRGKKADFQSLVINAFENTFPGIEYKAEGFRAQGNLVENDWAVDQNGEAYERAISKSKDPEVAKAFERAKRELAPRISSIRQEIAKKHGVEAVERERAVASPISLDAINSTDPQVRSEEISNRFGVITNRETNEEMRIYNLDPLVESPKLVEQMLKRYGYQVEYFAFEENKETGVEFRIPNLKGKGYDKNVVWIYDPRVSEGSFKGAVEYTRAWRISHEIAHGLTEEFMQERYGDSKRYGRLGQKTQVERGKLGKQVMVDQKALTLDEAQRAVEWEDVAFRAQRMILEEFGIEISDSEFHREANINLGDASYRVLTGDFNDPGDRGFLPTEEPTDVKDILQMLENVEQAIAKDAGREATSGIDLAKWTPVSQAKLKAALSRRKRMQSKLKGKGAGITEAQSFMVVDGEVLPPRPANAMRFRHFGQNDVSKLDPQMMGTGLVGAESRQGIPEPRVIAAYPEKGFKKEVGVGNNEYVLDIPISQVYDANRDALGLKKKAMVPTTFNVINGEFVPAGVLVLDNAKYHQLIKDAGFTAFFTPKAEGNLKGQARIFESVVVRKVQEEIIGRANEGVKVSLSVAILGEKMQDAKDKDLLKDKDGNVVRIYRGVLTGLPGTKWLPNLVFTTNPYSAQDYAQTTAAYQSHELDPSSTFDIVGRRGAVFATGIKTMDEASSEVTRLIAQHPGETMFQINTVLGPDAKGGMVVMANVKMVNPYRLGVEDVIEKRELDEIVTKMPKATQDRLVDIFLNDDRSGEYDDVVYRNAAQRSEESADPNEDANIRWVDLPDDARTWTYSIADSHEFVEAIKALGHDGMLLVGPHETVDPIGAIPQEMVDQMAYEGVQEVRVFEEDQLVPMSSGSKVDLVRPAFLSVSAAGVRVENMVNEWFDMTYNTPIQPDARIANDGAMAVLRPSRDLVYIDSIQSFIKGEGYGSAVLKQIVELADKHQVKLTLLASPFGRDPANLEQDELLNWYHRNGFRAVVSEFEGLSYNEDGALMAREPQPKTQFSNRKRNEGMGMKYKDLKREVDWMISERLGALPQMLDFHVLESTDELPTEIKSQMSESQMNQAEGLIADSAVYGKPRIYLFANNIVDGQRAINVILHESVGHFGLRAMLGASHDPMMDMLWKNFKPEIREIAKRNSISLKDDQGKRLAAEEFVAYLAGDILSGEKQVANMPGLVERILRAIKRFMITSGWVNPNERDVLALVASAARLAGRGGRYRDFFKPAYSVAPPKFFSQMHNAVNEKMPEQVPVKDVEQLLKTYQKKGFFKAEELNFLDPANEIEDWTLKGIITKYGDYAVSKDDAARLTKAYMDKHGEPPTKLIDATEALEQTKPTRISKNHVLAIIDSKSALVSFEHPWVKEYYENGRFEESYYASDSFDNSDIAVAFHDQEWRNVPFEELESIESLVEAYTEMTDIELGSEMYTTLSEKVHALPEDVFPKDWIATLDEAEKEQLIDDMAEREWEQRNQQYQDDKDQQIDEKIITIYNPLTNRESSVEYVLRRDTGLEEEGHGPHVNISRDGIIIKEVTGFDEELVRELAVIAMNHGDVVNEGGLYGTEDYVFGGDAYPYFERILTWDNAPKPSPMPSSNDQHFKTGNIIGHGRFVVAPQRNDENVLIVDEAQSDAFQGSNTSGQFNQIKYEGLREQFNQRVRHTINQAFDWRNEIALIGELSDNALGTVGGAGGRLSAVNRIIDKVFLGREASDAAMIMLRSEASKLESSRMQMLAATIPQLNPSSFSESKDLDDVFAIMSKYKPLIEEAMKADGVQDIRKTAAGYFDMALGDITQLMSEKISENIFQLGTGITPSMQSELLVGWSGIRNHVRAILGRYFNGSIDTAKSAWQGDETGQMVSEKSFSDLAKTAIGELYVYEYTNAVLDHSKQLIAAHDNEKEGSKGQHEMRMWIERMMGVYRQGVYGAPGQGAKSGVTPFLREMGQISRTGFNGAAGYDSSISRLTEILRQLQGSQETDVQDHELFNAIGVPTTHLYRDRGTKDSFPNPEVFGSTGMIENIMDMMTMLENTLQSEKEAIPFSKSWREMLIKGSIMEAVRLGSTKIAIAPGETHAKRWDAAEKTDELMFYEQDVPFENGIQELSLYEFMMTPSKIKPLRNWRSGYNLQDQPGSTADQLPMAVMYHMIWNEKQIVHAEKVNARIEKNGVESAYSEDREENAAAEESNEMREAVRRIIREYNLTGVESILVDESMFGLLSSGNQNAGSDLAEERKGLLWLYPGRVGTRRGSYADERKVIAARNDTIRAHVGGYWEMQALHMAVGKAPHESIGTTGRPSRGPIVVNAKNDLDIETFYTYGDSSTYGQNQHELKRGKGLRSFYNDVLPRTANKFLKKYKTKMELQWVDFNMAFGKPDGVYEVRWQREDGSIMTRQEVEDAQKGVVTKRVSNATRQIRIMAATMTPELEAAVVATGLPMFSIRKSGKTTAVDNFFKKIGPVSTHKSLMDVFKAFMHRIGESLRVETLDQFYAIKVAEEEQEILPQDQGYISARLAASSESLIRGVLENGYPIWREGAADLNTENGGLFDVLQGLQSKEKMQAWLGWMVANRAGRLKTEERENLFTDKEIEDMIAYPATMGWLEQFEEIAKKYADFKAKILDFAEEAGLINKDSRAIWENADHIPFYRVLEADGIAGPFSSGSIGNVRKQIHQLRGGKENLRDPLENIMVNMATLIDSSLRNHAARLIHNNLEGTGTVRRAPSMMPVGKATVNLSDIKERLNDAGVALDATGQQMLEGFGDLLSFGSPPGDNVSSHQENGKRKYFYIEDPMILKGLLSIRPKPWTWLMWMLRAPKRIGSHGITIVADFILKNWFRDMWHAFVLTRDPRAIAGKSTGMGVIPVWDSIVGAASALRKDETFVKMMAGGGAFESGYVNAHDPAAVAKVIRGRMAAAGFGHGLLDTPRKVFEFYRNISSSAENSHRVRTYVNAIEAGKSHKIGSFEARDLMDFSMRGAAPLIRFLTETVMFLNARAQGLYRTGKGFRESPTKILLRGLPLMLASVALTLLNWDDERYKALEDWERAAYYHFFDPFGIPGHYRLPKPFEVGAMFSTIPELTVIHWLSQEPDQGRYTSEALYHLITEQLNLSPQIQAVTPLYEIATNESLFMKRPIVTDWEEKGMLPELQSSQSTSPVMIWLANAMPDAAPETLRSPKKLQHLARGYFTSLGTYAIAAADYWWYTAHAEENGAPPTARTDELPLVRSFVRGTEGPKYTRYLNELYKVMEEADRMHYSIKKMRESGDMDQVQRSVKLREENAALLASRKPLGAVKKKLSKINTAIRAIYSDKDMSGDEKREEIDELMKLKNDVARQVWGFRPGGADNPFTEKVEGGISSEDLTGMSQKEAADTIRMAGYPRTADLVATASLSQREIEEIKAHG